MVYFNTGEYFGHCPTSQAIQPTQLRRMYLCDLDVKRSEGDPTLETRLQLKMETVSFTETF
jgi:hypothetical protein